MRIAWRVFLAFVLSVVAGAAAQVQLGVVFNADVELIVAMMVFIVVTIVATIVLAIALATGRGVGRAALGFMIAVAIAISGLGVWSLAAAPAIAAAKTDFVIYLYILVPTAIMVAVQWLLLRRMQEGEHA
jgi:hypothetical protein